MSISGHAGVANVNMVSNHRAACCFDGRVVNSVLIQVFLELIQVVFDWTFVYFNLDYCVIIALLDVGVLDPLY
jgi:hypothetical protein